MFDEEFKIYNDIVSQKKYIEYWTSRTSLQKDNNYINIDNFNVEDFEIDKILTDPKNALIKQYKQLFKMEGTKLEIDETVLNLIVDKALEFKLGARGLRGICEAIMTDLMYSLPSEEKPIKQFTITLDYALEKLKNAKLNQLKVA